MAKIYETFLSKLDTGATWSAGVAFKRSNPLPLDKYSVFESLSAAETYAQTSAVAYPGQIIAVVDKANAKDPKVQVYVLRQNDEDFEAGKEYVDNTPYNLVLQEIGITPAGDLKTIVTAEDGTISLAGIATLDFEREILGEDGLPTGEKETLKYQPLLTKEGLTWVEPSKTTVEGLAVLIQGLDGRVTNLETSVGKPAMGDVAATGLFKAIADETSRATQAEQALSEAIANIEIPVVGVADSEKIISLGTDKKLSTTLSLSYDKTDKKIYLIGKDSEKIGEGIDATPFIKDGMLDSVSYNAETNTLTFRWNTDSGKTENAVVLSDIIEPYTSGNGINISSNAISVKLADTTETFLTVDSAGLKLSGVQGAIDSAVEGAESRVANTYATKEYVGVIPNTEDKYKDVNNVIQYVDKKATEVLSQATDSSSQSIASVQSNLDEFKGQANSKFTTIETKLNGIEEGAQVNDIEVVKVNGTALNIDSKAVNITAVTGIKVNSDGDFKTGDVNLTGIVTSVKLPGENNTKTPDNAGQVDLSSLATNDSLTTLSGKVDSLSGHIGKLGDGTEENPGSGLLQDMADVKATLQRHSGEYTALKTQSDDDHAAIGVIQTHVSTSEVTLTDHGTRISNLESSVGNLETNIPSTYVSKTQFTNVTGIDATATPEKTLDARITENTTDIGTLKTNVKNLTDTVIPPISQDVETLKTWRKDTVDPHITDVGTKNDLATATTLFGRVKKAENAIGTVDDDASATGTLYARVKQNAKDLATVDTRIADAISKSAHLSREIVEFRYEKQNIDGKDTDVLVGFINQAGEAMTEYDANTIYMVRDNSTTGSDRYIEYLAFVTPGQTGTVGFSELRVIGSSDAKLENYVTKTSLTTTLSKYATKTYVDDAITGVKETYLPGILANYVKSATLGNDSSNKLTPDATGNINIPLALATKAGLVKSSTANNQVAVGADGTMTVNNLDVSRLIQIDTVEFVIDGGSASITNA